MQHSFEDLVVSAAFLIVEDMTTIKGTIRELNRIRPIVCYAHLKNPNILQEYKEAFRDVIKDGNLTSVIIGVGTYKFGIA